MHTTLYPPTVPYPTCYIIDPVAFFVALIGGPLIFTGMTLWAFFIPVAALLFGGPAYLIVGTPLLLWYLRHNYGAPNALAALAFKVMLFAFFVAMIIAAITGDEQLFGIGLWFTGFGMIFGPAWAYFFGILYQRMRRDFFAKPRYL